MKSSADATGFFQMEILGVVSKHQIIHQQLTMREAASLIYNIGHSILPDLFCYFCFSLFLMFQEFEKCVFPLFFRDRSLPSNFVMAGQK